MLDRKSMWIPGVETGRLLAYTDCEHAPLVAALTAAHEQSGVVLRGAKAAAAVRALPDAHRRQPIIVDVAAWTAEHATETAPLALPAPDGLFPVLLDDWAAAMISGGVSAVLTPSRFVRAGDWLALRAVLAAGAATSRRDVITLVATDAAMLSREHLPVFLRILDEHAGGRPLAFAFAASGVPIATRQRARGLREVIAAHPGSLLVAIDALAGCDAIARGVSAAIGVTGGLRRPSRPGDPTGGPRANGFAPGLFVRDLLASRSPTTYADWYANERSPTCAACGGRGIDTFTADAADKQAILVHNVHAWLALYDEIRTRPAPAAQAWLDGERRRALKAHTELRPALVSVEADPLLRALCEIDDLQGRRTTPTGEWI